jgi:hypothetical protein
MTASSRLSALLASEGTPVLLELSPALVRLVSQVEETLTKMDEVERSCRAMGIWNPDSPDAHLMFAIRARLQPVLDALEAELSRT